MYLSDDFIQELKFRNNLTDVVSNYVSLKRRGKNQIGLCPFHSEKTPSFTIYDQNGSFYCFGCGTGGDVITFIMKIENLDYMEAVKFLAQRAGMNLPEDEVDDSSSKLRKRIYEANREAARFFYSSLMSEEGKKGLAYFKKRELSDATIKHFGLGYAPASRFALSNYLKKKGFTENELVSANLAFRAKSGNGIVDRFFDRVMFPIIDLRGNVIAFGGRILTDQKPKYLNTSDTYVFSKSKNLFSLNNAKNSGENYVILCEGYMDVISVYQAGFKNAVATLGTAITEEQAILLKRYCDEVVICYDSDEAGQKATQRAIPLLRNAGINVKVLNIPDGKDPDEFIKKNGANGHAAFKRLIETSGNDIEYRLFKLSLNNDMNTTQGKVNYLSEATKLLSTLENAVERDLYASKLSEEIGVDKASIIEQMNKEIGKNRKNYKSNERRSLQQNISGRDDKVNTEHAKKLRATTVEEHLLAFLVKNPDNLPYVQSKLTPDNFSTEFDRKLFLYFEDRIQNNKDPLTLITKDFTSDEVSKIYKILNNYDSESATKVVVDEYIQTMIDESNKVSKEDVKNFTNDELNDLFKNMKAKRK